MTHSIIAAEFYAIVYKFGIEKQYEEKYQIVQTKSDQH